MFRHIVLVGLFAIAPSISADPALRIGKSITEDEATAQGISVLPSGSGLPAGRGSATEGAQIYQRSCASCHGEHGQGSTDFAALVGGRGSLGSDKPQLTVGSYWPTATTIFDYIARAMPYQAPGSLSADEVYALTAWILSENKIIDRGQVLDRAALLKVKMPNANGFVRPTRRE
jgi:cytochrome c